MQTTLNLKKFGEVDIVIKNNVVKGKANGYYFCFNIDSIESFLKQKEYFIDSIIYDLNEKIKCQR